MRLQPLGKSKLSKLKYLSRQRLGDKKCWNAKVCPNMDCASREKLQRGRNDPNVLNIVQRDMNSGPNITARPICVMMGWDEPAYLLNAEDTRGVIPWATIEDQLQRRCVDRYFEGSTLRNSWSLLHHFLYAYTHRLMNATDAIGDLLA